MNHVFRLLLIPLISSCTAIGYISDHRSYQNRIDRSDSITEPRQEIILETVGGEQITASFNEFSYKSVKNDSNLVSFPQPGDSIKIHVEDGESLKGRFRGIAKLNGQNQLIINPTWSAYRLKFIPINQLKAVESIGSGIRIDGISENNILINFVTDAEQKSKNLIDLRRLNIQEVRKTYKGTIIGFTVDVIVAVVAANMINNSLNNLDSGSIIK